MYNLVGILITITIVVAVFFVLLLLLALTRKFWCWFFKINDIIEVENRQKELLENINKIQIALYKKEFGISTDNKESSGLNSIPESGLKFNHAES